MAKKGSKASWGNEDKGSWHDRFFAAMMKELETVTLDDPECSMKIGMIVEATAQGLSIKPGLVGKLAGRIAPSLALLLNAKVKVSNKGVPNVKSA
jgi:hypothetical protein